MIWTASDESAAVATVLPLLNELGNGASLSEDSDYWRRLFNNDALRGMLRLFYLPLLSLKVLRVGFARAFVILFDPCWRPPTRSH
jgi:hypothetical protein